MRIQTYLLLLCSLLLVSCSEHEVQIHVVCAKDGVIFIDQTFALDSFSPEELTTIAPISYPEDCKTEAF